jgi:hypothetical protein
MKGTIIYAPATFEERGVAVGFTTPLLSQTRVRKDERGRLEVLIPSFAEGKGIYVVAWKAVPQMVSMTVHDRFLHDAIARTASGPGGCSPLDIRAAMLKTASGGLAGPQAVRMARELLAEDERQRVLVNYLLLVEILRAAGLSSMDLIRSGLDNSEVQKMTRELMGRAAKALHLKPEELYARTAELAETVTSLGLPQSPEPGRQRRLVKDLTAFAASMGVWANDSPTETAAIAGFCGQVANHTLSIARKAVAEIDERLMAIGPALKAWDPTMAAIRTGTQRISWLVDGWDFVVGAWRDALTRERQDQIMTVNEIFRILPLIPASESQHRHSDDARDVMHAHRRSVRAYEDWRTGALDVDLVCRIEHIKAVAA